MPCMCDSEHSTGGKTCGRRGCIDLGMCVRDMWAPGCIHTCEACDKGMWLGHVWVCTAGAAPV
jgi:hypothetical protein